MKLLRRDEANSERVIGPGKGRWSAFPLSESLFSASDSEDRRLIGSSIGSLGGAASSCVTRCDGKSRSGGDV